eukprot:CAMPEP_0171482154 /NCGR_PEP_ID=MMETSP0946-20130122/7263_1 /TAXON_ID=109269 /ORGANISM="Vaucheria litorea, Strain CCMP2940" /LENGTH=142 /DNA_ID=CAMNT_0012014045 /DNA_START=1 /DNA_END=425 /DNA_ORIENTATION=-
MKLGREKSSHAQYLRSLQNAQELADYEKKEYCESHNVSLGNVKANLCDAIDQRIRLRKEEIDKYTGLENNFDRSNSSKKSIFQKRKKTLMKGRKPCLKDPTQTFQPGQSSGLPHSISVQLSDFEIRGDFAFIIQDWKNRAVS